MNKYAKGYKACQPTLQNHIDWGNCVDKTVDKYPKVTAFFLALGLWALLLLAYEVVSIYLV